MIGKTVTRLAASIPLRDARDVENERRKQKQRPREYKSTNLSSLLLLGGLLPVLLVLLGVLVHGVRNGLPD